MTSPDHRVRGIRGTTVPLSRDRMEREINEILEQAGGLFAHKSRYATENQRVLRKVGNSVSAWERARLRDLSRLHSTRLMLLSFALLVGGFLLDVALPYEGYWLSLVGA